MEFRKHLVSREAGIYKGWPDLLLTGSGRLLCVFTECAHHKNRGWTQLVAVDSADGGEHWSEKRVIASARTADDGFYWNCARLSRLPGGEIALVADRGWGDFARESRIRSEICLFRSADDGRTWSSPEPLPLEGLVPDRLTVLDTGRRLIAAHRETDGKLAVFLRYSDDDGKTWSPEITLARDPRFNLCEAALLPLGGGRIVAFMRENSLAGRDCKKAISRDNGRSWSEVVDFPLCGCHRPTVGSFGDGTIFLTYRFCQGGKPGWGRNAQNLFAAVFDADSALGASREESWARIIPVDHDRALNSDLGYSGWALLPDDTIYIVSYIVDDAVDCGQIRGYSIPRRELLPLAPAEG